MNYRDHPNVREWLRKYPNHCTICEGHTDCANPCDCLAQLICPRCGSVDGIDGEDAAVPCSACGWVEDSGHGCPPSYAMIEEEKQWCAERATCPECGHPFDEHHDEFKQCWHFDLEDPTLDRGYCRCTRFPSVIPKDIPHA